MDELEREVVRTAVARRLAGLETMNLRRKLSAENLVVGTPTWGAYNDAQRSQADAYLAEIVAIDALILARDMGGSNV